jgi:hypothetical protein
MGDHTPTTPTSTPTPVATSITLAVTSLSFASLGATSQLSATVKDQNSATMASATVTWAATGGAATVSSAGLVTSVADGPAPAPATITATSGSVSATASVSVTVEVWASISASNYHTVGITTSGDAYAWGHNNYGQLGDGTWTQRTTPTLVSPRP